MTRSGVDSDSIFVIDTAAGGPRRRIREFNVHEADRCRGDQSESDDCTQATSKSIVSWHDRLAASLEGRTRTDGDIATLPVVESTWAL